MEVKVFKPGKYDSKNLKTNHRTWKQHLNWIKKTPMWKIKLLEDINPQ